MGTFSNLLMIFVQKSYSSHANLNNCLKVVVQLKNSARLSGWYVFTIFCTDYVFTQFLIGFLYSFLFFKARDALLKNLGDKLLNKELSPHDFLKQCVWDNDGLTKFFFAFKNLSPLDDEDGLFGDDDSNDSGIASQYSVVSTQSMGSNCDQPSTVSASSSVCSQSSSAAPLNKTLSEDKSLCGLCFENKKEYVLIPCGDLICYCCWILWKTTNTIEPQIQTQQREATAQQETPCPFQNKCPSEKKTVTSIHKVNF